MNAVIVDAITQYISKQEEWDEYLATTTFAYNNAVHSTTGFTPFELVLSRNPSILSVKANEYANLSTKPLSNAECRHEFLRRIDRFLRAARETMQERTARHKKVFGRHVRKRADIDIGDMVFFRTYVTEPARSPQLQFPVTGVYPVVRCFETGIEILTPMVANVCTGIEL
jgi:hypothetical protein